MLSPFYFVQIGSLENDSLFHRSVSANIFLSIRCKNSLHLKRKKNNPPDNCRNFHIWQTFSKVVGEVSFDKSFNYKKKYLKLDQSLKIRYVWSLYVPLFPQKRFSTMETLDIINFLFSKHTRQSSLENAHTCSNLCKGSILLSEYLNKYHL